MSARRRRAGRPAHGVRPSCVTLCRARAGRGPLTCPLRTSRAGPWCTHRPGSRSQRTGCRAPSSHQRLCTHATGRIVRYAAECDGAAQETASQQARQTDGSGTRVTHLYRPRNPTSLMAPTMPPPSAPSTCSGRPRARQRRSARALRPAGGENAWPRILRTSIGLDAATCVNPETHPARNCGPRARSRHSSPRHAHALLPPLRAERAQPHGRGARTGPRTCTLRSILSLPWPMRSRAHSYAATCTAISGADPTSTGMSPR